MSHENQSEMMSKQNKNHGLNPTVYLIKLNNDKGKMTLNNKPDELKTTDDGSVPGMACVTIQKIEQMIEDLKVVYPRRYNDFRGKITTQLEHVKAVENGEYDKSPYYIIKPKENLAAYNSY